MAGPANSASAERAPLEHGKPPAYFGAGHRDPVDLAAQPGATSCPLPPGQPDQPSPPVERKPTRPIMGRCVAFFWPLGPSRRGQDTGLHGLVGRRAVGAVGPDQQPARDAFRRQERNAPAEHWDEPYTVQPGATGVALTPPTPYRYANGR